MKRILKISAAAATVLVLAVSGSARVASRQRYATAPKSSAKHIGAMSKRIAKPVTPSTIVPKLVLHSQASYPGYPSLESLYRRSDLVVAVTITSYDKAYRGGEPPRSLAKDPGGPIFTPVRAVVNEVYKGKIRPHDTVMFIQTGGDLGDTRQILDDDPLAPIGTSYLVFLESITDLVATNGLRDAYLVVGGPSGRYLLTNGSLASIEQPPRKGSIRDLLNGRSLSDVAAEMRQLSLTPPQPTTIAVQ